MALAQAVNLAVLKRFQSCSQFWLFYKGIETLNKVFFAELLAFPLLHYATDFFGWDEDIADNVNNAVLGYAICNRNTAEAIDLYGNESTITSDINTQGTVLKQRR